MTQISPRSRPGGRGRSLGQQPFSSRMTTLFFGHHVKLRARGPDNRAGDHGAHRAGEGARLVDERRREHEREGAQHCRARVLEEGEQGAQRRIKKLFGFRPSEPFTSRRQSLRMEGVSKKHTPVDARRKDKVSAETGHRKDIKKTGAGGKGTLGKQVRAAYRTRAISAGFQGARAHRLPTPTTTLRMRCAWPFLAACTARAPPIFAHAHDAQCVCLHCSLRLRAAPPLR